MRITGGSVETDLGARLKGYGFEVIVATDCTVKEMEKQLKAFRTLLDTHQIGLFEPSHVCRRLVGLSYAAMSCSSSMA